MERKLFRQSALVVSVIVSALLALSVWNPAYPVLGIGGPCIQYVAVLSAVWIVWAVLTNLLPNGIIPSCGRKFWTNVAAFAVLFALYAALRFLAGWQAHQAGFGIQASKVTLAAEIVLAALSTWPLIAVSCREELGGLMDRRWVKWLCVAFCVAVPLYFCLSLGLHGWRRYCNGLFISPEAMYLLSPAVWYAAYCVFRFLRKLFSKDFGWDNVFFEK